MSGLAQTLSANSGLQGTGATIVQVWDAGVNAIAGAIGAGEVISVADMIISAIDPPPGSPPGPTLAQLQQQINDFATTVANELEQLKAITAAGQVQQHAGDLQNVLTGSDGSPGPLSYIGEIPDWKKQPGLPLPDDFNPSPTELQSLVRTALLQLIGGQTVTLPTAYWYLSVSDLPLFTPDNPWTYLGTFHMFNQPWMVSLGEGGYLPYDSNPYTSQFGRSIPAFDLSALHFTNDFSPTVVPGVPDAPALAFNPTWVLQQTMAAVDYYFTLCGAVLKNFPKDDSSVNDFVGHFNFLGGLSWYHDQIRAGIVCIEPPFPLDLLPIGPDGNIPSTADGGISTWSVPCGLSSDALTDPKGSYGFYDQSGATAAETNAPSSLWKRPFGALCNYTGFVAGYDGQHPSVGSYPDYVFPTPGEPVHPQPDVHPGGLDVTPAPITASGQWYTGFYCKYLVACLWRAKLVYNGMGLADMWRTINNMYVMFGQPPRPGPCFGDWSLMEVFRMLGSANQDTFPLPEQQYVAEGPKFKFTVRAFLQFMSSASPTPPSQLRSLRAALQA